MTPPAWPNEFNREQIRCWLEDASGVGLSVDDPLPDTLASTAEELGILPHELLIWVHEQPHPWTVADLTAWARKWRFNRNEIAQLEAVLTAPLKPVRVLPICIHCAAEVTDPETHKCKTEVNDAR